MVSFFWFFFHSLWFLLLNRIRLLFFSSSSFLCTFSIYVFSNSRMRDFLLIRKLLQFLPCSISQSISESFFTGWNRENESFSLQASHVLISYTSPCLSSCINLHSISYLLAVIFIHFFLLFWFSSFLISFFYSTPFLL